MKKKVVKFALTKSQKKKVKRILGVDCDTIELPLSEIHKICGGIKSFLNPRKRNLSLNQEQIEIIKEEHPRPPKSIVIDRDIALAKYSVGSEIMEEAESEGLKKYLDEI